MTTSASGTLRASIDLPPVPASVPTARHVLTQLLTAWAAEPVRDDAVLLVSELATNVVRHVVGRAALTVEVTLTEETLHVGVVDTSHVPPRARARAADGGHGLWLIAAMAHRWGSEEHDRGKRVWFELRRSAHGTGTHRTPA